MIFVKKTIQGIVNIIKWFPILWRDRDYDHYFFFVLLRRKLISAHKFFEDISVWSYKNKETEKIKLCVMLLNRIIGDNYDDMVFEKHNRRWGTPVFNIGVDGELNIVRPNVNKENEIQEREEFKNCVRHVVYMRKQDVKYLFNLLTKCVLEWWY